ncbi:unnamed protein product, partial [Brassica rapa subsp. narinosa]
RSNLFNDLQTQKFGPQWQPQLNNPWDVDAVADSMYSAITMADFEK